MYGSNLKADWDKKNICLVEMEQGVAHNNSSTIYNLDNQSSILFQIEFSSYSRNWSLRQKWNETPDKTSTERPKKADWMDEWVGDQLWAAWRKMPRRRSNPPSSSHIVWRGRGPNQTISLNDRLHMRKTCMRNPNIKYDATNDDLKHNYNTYDVNCTPSPLSISITKCYQYRKQEEWWIHTIAEQIDH